jgi:hypothetical protein
MCDFSLQSVRSRPAKVGDKLVTRDFGTGTRGFAAADDPGLAVCVVPGTELAFAGEVACLSAGLLAAPAGRSAETSLARRAPHAHARRIGARWLTRVVGRYR